MARMMSRILGVISFAALLASAASVQAERPALVTMERAFVPGQTKVCARFFVGKDLKKSAEKAGVPAEAIPNLMTYADGLKPGSVHPRDTVEMAYKIDRPGHLAQWTAVSVLIWAGDAAFEEKCA